MSESSRDSSNIEVNFKDNRVIIRDWLGKVVLDHLEARELLKYLRRVMESGSNRDGREE